MDGQVAQLQAATWRKSSGDCVEFAELSTGEIAMRSAADPQGPALLFTRAEIAAFVSGVKTGEFDGLTV